MSYNSQILAHNPSHYYRLNETSGVVAHDSSGFGRDASIVGTPTLGTPSLVSGDPDLSLTLAPIAPGGSYVSIPDDNSLDGLAQMTIMAWIKPTAADITASSSTAIEIVARDVSTARSFQFRISAGKLSFVKIPVATVTATGATTLVGGTIYHVACTWDAGVARVFLNGVQDGVSSNFSGQLDLGTLASTATLIGRRSADGSWGGVVDEVAIFAGQAFNVAQIAGIYSGAGDPPSSNVLSGVWGLG